jgi:hypothetical protein
LQQIGIFMRAKPLARPHLIVLAHQDEIESADADRNNGALRDGLRLRDSNPVADFRIGR